MHSLGAAQSWSEKNNLFPQHYHQFLVDSIPFLLSTLLFSSYYIKHPTSFYFIHQSPSGAYFYENVKPIIANDNPTQPIHIRISRDCKLCNNVLI